MRQIPSYVIRIYRRGAQALAGTVQDVRSSRSAPFQSLDELGDLLSGRRRFALRASGATATDPAESGAEAGHERQEGIRHV